MLHLPSERLAALADDEPTPVEAEHLAACGACAAALAAQRRLLSLASAERHRIMPALTEWGALRAALATEGLVREGVGNRGSGLAASTGAGGGGTGRRAGSPAVFHPVVARRWLLRAAAALALITGGVLAGRASAGAPMLPASLVARSAPAAVPTGDTVPGYGSTGEALAALTSAQREYHRAAAYLAAHDTTAREDGASDRYRTRLAALDQLAETSREALYAAPEDPVLNQYYLSTLSAREATIRQIGTALPVGTRLTRF